MTVKRFLGQAASTYDLWTVALSGTVISQTYAFTINAKSISYTATGTDTVASILAALIAVWNTTSNPPEFLELTAAGVGTVGSFTGMTLTQSVAGRPSTITCATGGGATFTVTNTVAATGPKFFDNSQNWSGGVAPVNSDTIVFDSGATSCCYNINTSLTGITLNVNPGFTGTIGLPLINATGQTPYNEYRTTSLTLAGGTAVINGTGCQQCNLAFGANTTTVRVLSTGQRVTSTIPVVLLTGGNGSSALYITAGDVATANYLGQTANFPTITTSYAKQAATDVTLFCGPGTTLGTVTKNGGIATIDANATTITQGTAGGTVNLLDAITVTSLNVLAGTCNLNTSGTIGTITLDNQAILNCDGDPRGKTVTNPISVQNSGVSIVDSTKTVNSGTLSIALNGNGNCIVNHGAGTTLVMT